MKTHKTTAKVGKGGELTLNGLPFPEGVRVQITMYQIEPAGRSWPPPEHPMKNSVIRYDDPLEPACPPEEWEALQ